jgi:preprotein translocase subunit SecG
MSKNSLSNQSRQGINLSKEKAIAVENSSKKLLNKLIMLLAIFFEINLFIISFI